MGSIVKVDWKQLRTWFSRDGVTFLMYFLVSLVSPLGAWILKIYSDFIKGQSGYPDFVSALKATQLNEWLILIVFSILLAIATFVRDHIIKKKIFYPVINSALIIDQIKVRIHGMLSLVSNNSSQLKDILIGSTDIVRLVLQNSNFTIGLISTNLMIVKDNELCIEAFYCKYSTNGCHVKLPLNQGNPLPGAPKAFFTHQIEYVHDVEARDVADFFVDKKYRSFFSLPIIDDDGIVRAILNVDSTEQDQFKNKKFITDAIKPPLEAMQELILLELDIQKQKAKKKTIRTK